ncbi:MAG: ribosome small subunit-dependent GTPase A [Bacteroidales bacterium]|nr:ribosome small subunit-dependent GTPase A [Bacteroidales bacterium]
MNSQKYRLEDYGYDISFEEFRKNHNLESLEVGRVISEHKERYILKTPTQDYEAEILGNLRYTAQSRFDFPAVGDWVAFSEYDQGKALIHAVFSRKSIIVRQAVGKKGEKQIIASNIDYAFIVQAVDRDFSVNRIERYLTICFESQVEPIIIINKVDLMEKNLVDKYVESIKERVKNVPVFTISNQSGQGIATLKSVLETGKTYCLLGSSGVGKSTMINTLLGQKRMETGGISESTNKGKHVTTRRELHLLDNGALLIDNPGMREVGIADAGQGLELTFNQIVKLAQECKFSDCTHTSEVGCAVMSAVVNGLVDRDSYENFLRMEREQNYYESTVAERRQKDKHFGKMVKTVKKFYE